jgi:RNA polymerase sigma-70 factor, ECF subfamily
MMPQLQATLDRRRSTVARERRVACPKKERDRETVRTTGEGDGGLVEALRLGETTAAEQLVAVYGDRAYRLAIRITGHGQDAEEVVQDAFWAVIRKIDTFRGDAAFGSWLYRIVANAAYQKLRGRRGQRTELSLDEMLPVFDEQGRHVALSADWSAHVDDASLQTDLRTALTTALEELPAHYRSVVVLRDVEGWSHFEIAETLNISVPNVKTRVHRARLFLRKRLGDALMP